ncbi:MAG TPA: alpha/beta fold hydrolase [Dongiaceae bacterium]|nr:alpha/beta fold hydrolase [Dongiaceae bacterium]
MRRWVVTLILLLAVCAIVLFRPLEVPEFRSHPHPASGYEDALARVEVLSAEDGPDIAPECGTRLMTHGKRARRVFVLLHGLTNCPAQFRVLGESLYVRGANVLIPRLPHHGLADRMTGDLDRLEAAEMCRWGDRVLDAASGLGDSVTVVGLSLSAVLAAWAAEERPDVAHAVIIAPMFGPHLAPGMLTPAATRLLLSQHGKFIWWDDKRREHLRGPRHVYPRFSMHAAGEVMRLGASVLDVARRRPLRASTALVVTVGSDGAIDNGAAAALARAWESHREGAARVYEFPARLELNHDIIDPEQVGGNPALVYPVLLGLMGS